MKEGGKDMAKKVEEGLREEVDIQCASGVMMRFGFFV